MKIAFMFSLTVILMIVLLGCAKNELPSPANPKYVGIQPVDEDKNGVIDEKDVELLKESSDNWFKIYVLPSFTKAGIDLETDEDIYTDENTNILKNNLTVVEWEKLTASIDEWNKLKIQLEATKKVLDENPPVVDSGTVRELAYYPDRLICHLEDGRLVYLIGISIPTYASKFRKMSDDMFYKLALKKVVKIEYDIRKTSQDNAYLVGYIYVGEIFVNAEMVSRGYARANPTSPNHKYDSLFVKLEKEAKEKKRGIWAFTDEF